MIPAGGRSDPRSVITPDAFHISPDLVGLKLASGRRRLAAILIDLFVVAIITVLTRSYALVLGIVAAVLLVRAGFARNAARAAARGAPRSTVFDRAMRWSVGCLGLGIGVTTMIVWLDPGPAGGDSDDNRVRSVAQDATTARGRVRDVLAAAVVRSAYEEAGSLAEAESRTRDFVEASEDLGMEPAELRAVLLANIPQGADWSEGAPAMIDRLVPLASEPIEARDVIAVRDEVSLYTTEEALQAYISLLRSGGAGDVDAARRDALEGRIAGEIAADTLTALAARVDELTNQLLATAEGLSETEAALEALESRGIFGSLRSLLDELGFGFGWASLYFTVMLSWWQGQTIGKRIARVRVLRLDGGQINWWVAFERSGGYAAGIATGFLGFLQVFWDANRQMIHDRIAGTVVTLDPPQKAFL